MTRTVAYSLPVFIMLLTNSCLDSVNDHPTSRTPELEMRELSEALLSLQAEGYDIDTTDLGIYYIIHEEGEGPLAQEGDTISLEYTGYLMGGYIFDASSFHYPDGIWEFVLDSSELIPGFVDGISVMNKGAAINMIIPSTYAYGATGSGPIEPYTTILFTARLHDLKPGP
ncbi:MAG: FKBP-type peptidyl-prolyl cis-trans isomerase [Bacteroidales bacterium]